MEGSRPKLLPVTICGSVAQKQPGFVLQSVVHVATKVPWKPGVWAKTSGLIEVQRLCHLQSHVVWCNLCSHPKTWCCPCPGPLLRVISRFMAQQQQGSEKTSMAKRATKCHVLAWGLMSKKGPCWCPRAMFQPWLYRNEWHIRLPAGMMEFKVASKGLFYIHSPAAVGV